MSGFIGLTADERSLAIQFQIREYFKRNKSFLLFVSEMKKIVYRRLDGAGQIEWARDAFVEPLKSFLANSDELYKYINGVYTAQNGSKNIPAEDWKHMCFVSSKILIQMGWEYEEE